MFDEPRPFSTSHLPSSPFLVFLLVVGVMVGLAVWGVISAPRNRAASEDRDLRGQLQTELRSLVGAPTLPPAGSSTPFVPLSAPVSANWKWIGFVFLIGLVITAWATINYYVAASEEIDDDEPAEARAPADAAAAPRPAVIVPEWMKVAIRSSRDGIVSLDSSGAITNANPAAEKLLGLESGKLPGEKAFDFFPGLGANADSLRRFSQVAASTDAAAVKKSGDKLTLQLALHRIADKAGLQYVASFHELPPPAPAPAAPAPLPAPVAEAKPAAARAPLAPAAAPIVKGEALHGLENQITMMGGFSEMVAFALEAEHPAHADAEAAVRAAARAHLLCHEVAGHVQPHARLMDLDEFAASAATALGRVLDEGCHVSSQPSASPTEVWADPELLERSLCSIAWRTQDLAGGLKRVSLSVSGGRLEFRMAPAGPVHLATPATFDALPAIDWIEKQSGTIEMEERSETGVRFRIWLPAAAQARLPRGAQQQAEAAAD